LTSERKEYVPTDEVIAELKHFLSTNPELDFITFSGAGEPTLHSGLGKIVDFIKSNYPQYKIALLSNGSLFSQESLRKEVSSIDLILPSLDAVDKEVFHKINRPNRSINLDQIVFGLIELKKVQTGKMWLEIFIIPGINDSADHIEKLKNAIHQIKPDLVQLNSLDRPGAESWVSGAAQDHLEKIAKILDYPTEIIAKFPDRKESKAYHENIENSILEMVKRRPCTVEDLSLMLNMHVNEINKYLDVLIKKDRVHAKQMERGLFYWAKA